jgi:hypothetical protein
MSGGRVAAEVRRTVRRMRRRFTGFLGYISSACIRSDIASQNEARWKYREPSLFRERP